MNDRVKSLKEKFEEIKSQGLIRSLRSGPTGVGYTFESLIGKSEDQSYKPDFQGIEIKTKIRYSESPITLFNLTPKGINDFDMKKLTNLYGYPDKKYKYYKNFKGDVYSLKHLPIGRQGNYFNLMVDYISKKVFLFVYQKDATLVNDEMYWNFSDLEERLTTKLNTLAFIKAYPHVIDGATYYKYIKIELYKLKGFDIFINLLKSGDIYITFNIDTYKFGRRKGQIHDHGTAFRIKRKNLEKLFTKIS